MAVGTPAAGGRVAFRRIAATGACYVRTLLRSYAAVLFIPKAATGLLVLVATCFEPTVAVCGLLAAVTGTVAVCWLGYRRELVESGFYGINALLSGLVLGHGRAPSAGLLLMAALVGIVAALLTAVLAESFDRLARLPVLALPFVVTASLFWSVLNGYVGVQTAPPPFRIPDLPFVLPHLVHYALRICGSIVLLPTTSVGLLVLLAIIVHSRLAATMGLMGVVLSAMLGRWIFPHVDPAWLETAGYNAMLTSMAIGAVFFVPSFSSMLWAAIAGGLSVWLTLAVEPAAARIGWPVLAWPFVLVGLVTLRALGLRDPSRGPQTPLLFASPEVNLRYLRTLACRFGLPCPARVILPVRGTWTITQGFDGEHTHQGSLRHALDFEITDAEGFPFRGNGTEVTDYHCFGEPVYAPMAGTVVFSYSEHDDNRPGDQNLAYPYGNMVVIQHGVGLFSVLAHLQRGSVIVRAGQYVTSAEVIARVGASGRSPRPHLHLQMQAQAELGVPTIPFEIAHYAVLRGGVPEYVPAGVPKCGDRLSGDSPFLVPELLVLRVGGEFALRDRRNRVHRIRSELSPLGERSLYDLESADRLCFSALDGVATFTSLRGTPRSPLAVIALAMPRVPPFGGAMQSTESVPVEWILSRWCLTVHDFFRALGLGVKLIGTSYVTRDDVGLSAETRYEIRWLWYRARSMTASLRIEGDQVTSLELDRGTKKLVQMSCAPLGAARRRSDGWRLPRLHLDTFVAALAVPVAAVVAAVSLLLAAAPVRAKAISNPLADTYRFEASGDLSRAIQAATEAVGAHPRQYFPLLRLAYLEFAAKRFRPAAEHYAAAATLAPKTIEPRLGQLQALIAESEYEAALEVADEILDFDRQNYLAHSRRAWALYRLERYSIAVDEYSSIVELYPGDIEMRLGRAYSLFGARRPVEAAIEFREVLKRVPDERRARAALGMP
jgi:urea transporter/Flp pilus assembly protein TadD